MNTVEIHASPKAALDRQLICYAPLIDRRRKTVGTRLTTLGVSASEKIPLGRMLQTLQGIWPGDAAPTLIAPLDLEVDDSAGNWLPPRNAILEMPAAALRDAAGRDLAQRLYHDGIRLALRGRPEAPLAPELLECFEYLVTHIDEDPRHETVGLSLSSARGASRAMPSFIAGLQSISDADAVFTRGAAASVGWPLDDPQHRKLRPLQPGQTVVLELIRLVRDDAELSRIEATLKRDPAIAFKLLRLVNSAAFGLPVQITSFEHAIMMLGYKKMMRWLSVLLTTASKDANTFPLMHSSIRRGLFLEYLGAADGEAETRDELFIAGAFSLLDRITGARFEQLFDAIALSDDVLDAIVRREGPYAPYLALIEAIERSDAAGIEGNLEILTLPVAECNLALLKAMAAANTLDAEM